ncbi:MAG: tetratricopeptide repeat protein [Nitrospira sp.]|nr:tetratricopeptide repeat protein [Nitrospira sp. BO4]
MPPDRSRVLQQAQLLASRGQYDAAIAEWKKLAVETPADGTIHNSIGDLQLKRNASSEAAASFLQAASAFRTEGATLKAIAAFKKVLKCDPTRYEVYRHLGDLNIERGLVSSAVQDYLTLGKYYLKERRGKDALEIYKKIVVHDPSNLGAQQRVAELCVQENLQDEATTVYLQLGRERSAQGRYDEAKDAYLAVLRIDQANSEATQFVESLKKGGTGQIKAVKPASSAPAQKSSEPLDLLAEATRRIDERQFAGAEAILNQMLTREPGNPQVCQLLARLHLQRGDVQVALGEYRFLAGAALRAQDLMLAESLIQEFLTAEPNSVPLLELKGELHEEKGDRAEAARHYARAIELLLEHPEPGMESLHEELFDKVRSLSNDENLVHRLAERMRGGSTKDQSQAADAESLPAESDAVHADRTRDRIQEDQECSPAGAAPNDSGSVVEDHGPQTHVEPLEAVHEPELQHMSEAVQPERDAMTSEQPVSMRQGEGPSAEVSASHPAEPGGVQTAVEPAAPPPDYEAHYAIGVAYKNMGLYGEAKAEFQVSMNNDSFYLDSALMTAVCLKEERSIAQAIQGLETVLADPRCQGAKGQAIRYELGLLYEAEEQWEKAVHAFQSIPSFHDVPQRLAALKARPGMKEVGFRFAS